MFIEEPKERLTATEVMEYIARIIDVSEPRLDNLRNQLGESLNRKVVRPKFTDVCNKYFKRILNVKTEGWILSALEENEEVPKQKYIRYLIIKAWTKRHKIGKFY
jgi:hypothetical protein